MVDWWLEIIHDVSNGVLCSVRFIGRAYHLSFVIFRFLGLVYRILVLVILVLLMSAKTSVCEVSTARS